MARKKKSFKDLNDSLNILTTASTQDSKQTTTDTPTSSFNIQKRGSFDELLLQTPAPPPTTLQYQSDSELMALKRSLNLEKNKSNLFLIKSYSFIDKTNNKRPLQLKKYNSVKENNNNKELKQEEENVNGENNKKKSKNKNHKNKTKPEDKSEKLEKPKKPPKLKKLKKSKSTHDSTENLQDLQELLRKPSIILEDEEQTQQPQRPQSLPLTQNPHKCAIKAKTLDDIETPRLKRDSFIRHSLQSIRRSFSSSKKHNNNISITSSSSSSSASSACSNSSTIADAFKKSKHKDDIGNLKDIEELNYLVQEKEEAEESKVDGGHLTRLHKKSNKMLITLNEQQFANESYNNSDALSVLKEEDEKDLMAGSWVNISSGGEGEVGGGYGSSDFSSSGNNNNNKAGVIRQKRSTSSVSTLAQLSTESPLSPMAPLQTHTECHSVQCLNTLDKDLKSLTSTTTNNNLSDLTTDTSSSPPQKSKRSSAAFQQQLSITESLQSTSIGCATSSEYSSARSLKNSATSLTPLSTLNSSASLRSISPSRRSASSNSSSTAKHEQQSTAAATASAAAAAATTTTTSTTTTATTSNGSLSATTAAATTTPPEKEKKRKEISSTRVKKFHRHFAQVSKDEKLINYFSCALVSDILLQGHLYITDQHFAFYSNVFGYVTKVVIPTSSVTKISKEKTAKIIPNAVGVATADERHVFGSFISREAAFRLMCSVCPPLGVPEILPKDTANIEISEEYSIEDDSSCSISGNESPAQITELLNATCANGGNLLNNDSQMILRRSVASSNLSINDMRHSDIPITNAKSSSTATTASLRSSAPAASCNHYTNGSSNAAGSVNLLGLKTVLQQQQPALIPSNEIAEGKLTVIAGCTSSTTSATSTPTPSTSSSPTTVMTTGILSPSKAKSSKMNRIMSTFSGVNKKLMLHLKFPTEIHVVYLGVVLTIVLALFSIFLLYRILDIEAKTSGYRSPVEFNWRSGNDDDIFSEALRFQKQLQLKSTEEAQHILKSNLEQIAKVRRSLETLSMLIHDRSSSFVSTHTDDSD